MAEKELRKMNRTELIEIIYALQQNDRTLRQENEELHRQLDDKLIRIEQSGSIAEAALSLNHIFEDAEAAAKQYLESIRSVYKPSEHLTEQLLDAAGHEEDGRTSEKNQEECEISQEEDGQENDILLEDTRQECSRLMEEAHQEYERILGEAQQERDRLLEETQKNCDSRLAETEQECERLREETKQECDRTRAEAAQEAWNKVDALNREIKVLIDKYPVLREYLEKELGTGEENESESGNETGGDST